MPQVIERYESGTWQQVPKGQFIANFDDPFYLKGRNAIRYGIS